jgi:hypothetical protein
MELIVRCGTKDGNSLVVMSLIFSPLNRDDYNCAKPCEKQWSLPINYTNVAPAKLLNARVTVVKYTWNGID